MFLCRHIVAGNNLGGMDYARRHLHQDVSVDTASVRLLCGTRWRHSRHRRLVRGVAMIPHDKYDPYLHGELAPISTGNGSANIARCLLLTAGVLVAIGIAFSFVFWNLVLPYYGLMYLLGQ